MKKVQGLSSQTNGVNTIYSGSTEVNWDNMYRLASLVKGQISNKSNNKHMFKLSTQQKKELTKDQQALIKAGYLDQALRINTKCRKAVWDILYNEYRDELVKLAKKEIKEAEEKEK